MIIKKHIPNSITLLNLIIGFIAILINDPFISPLLILACGALDYLDGWMARVLNVKSALGEQLDSLSDLVSFGLAPAFLFYEHVMPSGYLSMILVSLLPAMAALRLAIFNLDDSQGINFAGLASPSNGIFFAFLTYSWTSIPNYLSADWIIYLLPPVFALLMVLPIKMFSLKGFGVRPVREKLMIGLLILSGIVLFTLYQFDSVALIVLVYILLSFINDLIGLSQVD